MGQAKLPENLEPQQRFANCPKQPAPTNQSPLSEVENGSR